jgi:hypothetical protein
MPPADSWVGGATGVVAGVRTASSAWSLENKMAATTAAPATAATAITQNHQCFHTGLRGGGDGGCHGGGGANDCAGPRTGCWQGWPGWN